MTYTTETIHLVNDSYVTNGNREGYYLYSWALCTKELLKVFPDYSLPFALKIEITLCDIGRFFFDCSTEYVYEDKDEDKGYDLYSWALSNLYAVYEAKHGEEEIDDFRFDVKFIEVKEKENHGS